MKLDWYRKQTGAIHAKGKDGYYSIAADFASFSKATEGESEDDPEFIYVVTIMDTERKRLIDRCNRKTILAARQYCQGWEGTK